MKKHVLKLWIAVVLPLLLGLMVLAVSAETVYINDGETVLDSGLAGAWAAGAEGTVQLPEGEIFALTANGTEKVLSEMPVPSPTPMPTETPAPASTPAPTPVPQGGGTPIEGATGGGGLLFDDGTVRIAADRIRVALYYFYSAKRDSSLQEAWLENAVGGGYAFGYLDQNRRFVPYGDTAVTDSRTIIMRPTGATGVAVYDAYTNDLLYSVRSTTKNSYFVVHPLTEEGVEAVTWFKQKRYCGDFAYADLGNGKLTVVNIVSMERYAAGVCAGEMGAAFPLEALKAQAVAARTYGMYNIHSGAYSIPFGYDLTGEDYSQVYLGYTENETLLRAARETENQYLTYEGRIIEALFSAASGGESLDSEEVFSNVIPYLRGYPDPYEGEAWTRGPFGHRVGMSQWGAYAMAKYHNMTYKDILGFYYTKVGLSYGYVE